MLSIRTHLVEEDAERARLIQAYLRLGRDGPFDVEHRPTLDAALTRLREGDIDFVVLGPDLPDVSRVEALDRLRGVAPRLPGLVVREVGPPAAALRGGAFATPGPCGTLAPPRRNPPRTTPRDLDRSTLRAILSRIVLGLSRLGLRFERSLCFPPAAFDEPGFAAVMERERARADDGGRALCLALLRPRGALRREQVRLATRLASRMRAYDTFGWYRDGSLAILLPETSVEGARAMVLAVLGDDGEQGWSCTIFSYSPRRIILSHFTRNKESFWTGR